MLDSTGMTESEMRKFNGPDDVKKSFEIRQRPKFDDAKKQQAFDRFEHSKFFELVLRIVRKTKDTGTNFASNVEKVCGGFLRPFSFLQNLDASTTGFDSDDKKPMFLKNLREFLFERKFEDKRSFHKKFKEQIKKI